MGNKRELAAELAALAGSGGGGKTCRRYASKPVCASDSSYLRKVRKG